VSLRKQRDDYQNALERTEKQILAYQAQMQTSPAPANAGDTMLLSNYGSRLQEVEYRLHQVQQELSIAKSMAHSVASKAETLPTGLPVDTWRTKLLGLEYELHVTEVTGGPQSPKVVAARRTAEIARTQLRSEIANYMRAVDINVNADIAPKLAEEMVLKWEADYVRTLVRAAPRELAELQSLLRKQSMQTAILVNVQTETTKAEIDEQISSKDPIRFLILDKPGLNNDDPVNKRWGRNSAIGAVLGLLIGFWVAVRRPFPSPNGPHAPPA
jgi:hypothetical protein